MTNGLITIDLEERVVTLNETAERILARRRAEMVGLPVDRVFGDRRPSVPSWLRH